MQKVNYCVSALVAVLLLTGVGLCTATAGASEYPTKPISIVIQFSAGGGADIALRGISQEMEKYLKKAVVVESKPGAAGIIAGDYIARAEPDGYTIGAFTSPAFDPEPYNIKTSYTREDLIPIVRVLCFPYALITRKDAPWKNLSEFIKYVQKNPKKVTWGQIGVGNRYAIFAIALAREYNLDMVPVPFKGASGIVTAVLGGHIDCGIVSVASSRAHAKAGRLMMLAVQYGQRISSVPEVPTFEELGYHVDLPPHYLGLFAPKGTPGEITKKLHDALKWAEETSFVKEYALKRGFELYYGSAQDLIKDIEKDRRILDALAKEGLLKEKP